MDVDLEAKEEQTKKKWKLLQLMSTVVGKYLALVCWRSGVNASR